MDEAFRLTFVEQRGGYVLRSIRRLQMRLPASDPIGDPPFALPVGRFAELRSEAGAPLFRRALPGTGPRMTEYPTGDPERPFGRAEMPNLGVLSVLVPALPAGRTVSISEATPLQLFGNRIDAIGRRDLVTVDLPKDGR